MDGNRLIFSLIISLFMTLALENGFCSLVFKVRGTDLLLVALANVLTNPPVVLTYTLLSPKLPFSPWILVAALEITAVVIEALVYKYCSKNIKRPILMSITANAFSYTTGLILSLVI